MSQPLPSITTDEVKATLREGREIALIDLREEGAYSLSHPLFAVCVPLSRLETLFLDLVPRADVPVVLYDEGEGFVERAVPVLERLGYTNLSALEGGLSGWAAAGGELFRDVNVPSKAFGELVEHVRATPSLTADDVHDRIVRGDNLVVLDARRFEEYQVMSIPGAVSVPGAELALRVRDLAPDPQTTVIVNCAGRTRSLIGAQSLVNQGISNPVFALRNGTIGWSLAGYQLDHGAARRWNPDVSSHLAPQARQAARDLADRASVRRIDIATLDQWRTNSDFTLYLLDVRDPDSFEAGHLPGFRSAPGGQLVQATDEWIGVRHAHIVLVDDDGVRANMTAHWLAQMGWENVHVLDEAEATGETGTVGPTLPSVPSSAAREITTAELEALLEEGRVTLVDLATSTQFLAGHIAGARFALRRDLPELAREFEGPLVITSPDGALARYAAAEIAELRSGETLLLSNGTHGWRQAGLPLEAGLDRRLALSSTEDLYRRPYEGTDNPVEAMEAYLEWEFGLVAQLERDGTHGFKVL